MKLLDKIITRGHHIVTNKENIIDVLEVLNANNIHDNLTIGCCGWDDDPRKWYMHFYTTNEKWEILRRDLEIVRVWDARDIPIKDSNEVYSDN